MLVATSAISLQELQQINGVESQPKNHFSSPKNESKMDCEEGINAVLKIFCREPFKSQIRNGSFRIPTESRHRRCIEHMRLRNVDKSDKSALIRECCGRGKKVCPLSTLIKFCPV